ncbi:hypothetical protein BDV28DRAFT_145580 [Aspergillus coremiiformis]|uniref:Uncharacterized protein n=1 Tax=Aspergillus coremiiformis TaxID=138285 RepID=A0A5N6ZEI7_9EURO|nr:hypothetical protein BDV28DRAFT_145580 [Aspergillus coremiiformis]
MSDRKRISYTYRGIEAYEEHDKTVTEIIKEDTGVENWPVTTSMPPRGIPPPLTTEAIDKLKALDGVIVIVQDEDD